MVRTQKYRARVILLAPNKLGSNRLGGEDNGSREEAVDEEVEGN